MVKKKMIRFYNNFITQFIAFLLIMFSLNCSKQSDSTDPKTAAKADKIINHTNMNLSVFSKTDFAINNIITDNAGNMYFSTYHSGIFFKKNNSKKVSPVNHDILKRRSHLDYINEYRTISAMVVSSINPGTIYVATKHSVCKTLNYGQSWEIFPMNGFDDKNYISALCLDNNDNLIIGTSYSGINRFVNGKITRVNKGLPYEPYSPTLVFYEKVSSLHYDSASQTIFAGFILGKGLHKLPLNEDKWISVKAIQKDSSETVFDISTISGKLYFSTENGVYTYDSVSDASNLLSDSKISFTSPGINYSKEYDLFYAVPGSASHKNNKNPVAAGKKALYTTPHFVRNSTDVLMKYITATKSNAVVIDLKDDWGDIYYDIDNSTAKNIGALKEHIDYPKIIKSFKDNNIYTIARIVTFKDKNLYMTEGNKYAVWDKQYNKPWKAQNKEYWTDPYSDFVRNYNIEIAKEAVKMGFDEVQFDYIRFPADGPLERADYRFNKYSDTYKSEIMEDFLQQAKKELSVPISTDIYGVTASYHFGNSIGQDIFVFARHSDAVSPMIYPSHYGPSFMNAWSAEDKPYKIVEHGCIRSIYLSGNAAYMRPYLQAFNMLSPTWGTGYILKQIEAAEKSSCSGYIFWNAAVNYGMVRNALSQKE